MHSGFFILVLIRIIVQYALILQSRDSQFVGYFPYLDVFLPSRHPLYTYISVSKMAGLPA